MFFLLLIFLLLILSGTLLLKISCTYENNFALLAGGAIFGVTLYIFILNLISKILPGPKGIILSTFILLLLTIFLAIKYRIFLPKFSIHFNAKTIIPLLIVLFIVYFAKAKMLTILPAADSSIQWAYAGSFARGNNPIMVPWQPDFVPGYHLGAYIFEGALDVLSGLHLLAIHGLINIYFFASGLMLSIFILWNKQYLYKNLWLTLAALVIFLAYGVVIIAYPNNNFLLNLKSAPDFLINLKDIPENIIAKGTAGAALADLDTLSYLPARSLSISMALLILSFFLVGWRNNRLKIAVISLSLSVLALVEESMFLPILLTLICLFIFSRNQRTTLFYIILFTVLISVLQGGFVTDNLFLRHDSAFEFTLPLHSNDIFSGKLTKLIKNYNYIGSNGSLFNWLIPSPLILLLPGLIYGLLKKNALFIGLVIYSLICFSLFLLIQYKYESSNNIRFFNFGYIASGLSIAYLLYFYLSRLSVLKNLIFLIIFVIFVGVPTFLPEADKQILRISEGRKVNTTASILSDNKPNDPFYQIAEWAKDNLPLNARLLSLDGSIPVPGQILEFEYRGIYTTLGPNSIRVLRQEPGAEFTDLTLTLNPSLLILTKTNYIYIESKSNIYQQLPKIRKQQLDNPIYFQPLVSIKDFDQKNFYALYRVTPEFLALPDIEEGTFTYLRKLIPVNSTIYIGDYPEIDFWYRMAATVALKDYNLFLNNSKTRYMAIETRINEQSGDKDGIYNFYLLGPNEKPNFPAQLIWSNIYATAWERN